MSHLQIVNLKNPNKSIKDLVLPLSLQNSSQCVSESPDSSNLLSRASFRASKQVYLRERPQTCCIARYLLRSIFIFRNAFLEVLALSSSEESEKNMGSNSKTSTTSRVTTKRLSSKKVSSSKLSITLSILFPEEKAFTIS